MKKLGLLMATILIIGCSCSKVEETPEENGTITKSGTEIVDFYATWCGPCKMMKPLVKQYNEEHLARKIISIDVDKNKDLAKEYKITSIPTFVILKDGIVVKQKVGGMTYEELVEFANQN